MKIELSEQVVEFVRSQAPEPRKRLRRALRDLASERGDIKALEGPLSRYRRLRVGPYRIIFTYSTSAGKSTTIQCIFAQRRGLVYTVFSHMLQGEILGE